MAFTLDLIKPGDCEATRYSLEDGSYIIGRGASCALQLPELEVSERHALLMLRGRKARMEDLHSANGTYVNGNPIDGIVDIPPDAIVQIGNNMMRISPAEEAVPPQEAAETAAAEAEEPRSREAEPPPAPPPPDPLAEIRRQAKEQIQRELIARLDLKRLTVAGVDRAGLERQATESWSRCARAGSCRRASTPRASSARCSTRPCASARSRSCSPTTP